MIENPYLKTVETLLDDTHLRYYCSPKYCQKYAWAIPNEEAINEIVKYSPLIEIGAGTGYWASLIRAKGGDILPFDLKNSHFGHTEKYTEILVGNSFDIPLHKDRTLFLCWPPYDDYLAYNCLEKYEGRHFLFVGECDGGCTGNTKFWDLLTDTFKLVKRVEIPQWNGLHDSLMVWERLRHSPKVTK